MQPPDPQQPERRLVAEQAAGSVTGDVHVRLHLQRGRYKQRVQLNPTVLSFVRFTLVLTLGLIGVVSRRFCDNQRAQHPQRRGVFANHSAQRGPRKDTTAGNVQRLQAAARALGCGAQRGVGHAALHAARLRQVQPQPQSRICHNDPPCVAYARDSCKLVRRQAAEDVAHQRGRQRSDTATGSQQRRRGGGGACASGSHALSRGRLRTSADAAAPIARGAGGRASVRGVNV
jgi:hypothetical protein